MITLKYSQGYLPDDFHITKGSELMTKLTDNHTFRFSKLVNPNRLSGKEDKPWYES